MLELWALGSKVMRMARLDGSWLLIVFAGNDTIIVKGERLQFEATAGGDYKWTPALYLNDSEIRNPTGHFTDTGLFSYVYYVTNSHGCKAYDTVNVWVVNHSAFFVPTAFTPNGDGLNDVFSPVMVGCKAINYLKVYNRWGNLVYSGQGIGAGWDGTYKNRKVDMDTYYWQMSYIDLYDKQAMMKGSVTVVR